MIISRLRVPWFTKAIKRAKKIKRKAECRWRKTFKPDDLADFKMKRNLATSLMKRERCNYYSDWVSQNSHDQRQLFRKVTILLGLKNQSPLPFLSNIGALTEEFADIFIMKIDDIRATIDSSSISLDRPSSIETEGSLHSFPKFSELSDKDIRDLVGSAFNTNCVLDTIPSSLIKSSIPILVSVLKKLINVSLSSGYFCPVWKRAIICLKRKKTSLKPILENYRPISNLSFVSNLTEKAAAAQVVGHLNSHNLFPRTQSAYREHHSTETALLKVKNDILLNMNKEYITLLVYFDLGLSIRYRRPFYSPRSS